MVLLRRKRRKQAKHLFAFDGPAVANPSYGLGLAHTGDYEEPAAQSVGAMVTNAAYLGVASSTADGPDYASAGGRPSIVLPGLYAACDDATETDDYEEPTWAAAPGGYDSYLPPGVALKEPTSMYELAASDNSGGPAAVRSRDAGGTPALGDSLNLYDMATGDNNSSLVDSGPMAPQLYDLASGAAGGDTKASVVQQPAYDMATGDQEHGHGSGQDVRPAPCTVPAPEDANAYLTAVPMAGTPAYEAPAAKASEPAASGRRSVVLPTQTYDVAAAELRRSPVEAADVSAGKPSREAAQQGAAVVEEAPPLPLKRRQSLSPESTLEVPPLPPKKRTLAVREEAPPALPPKARAPGVRLAPPLPPDDDDEEEEEEGAAPPLPAKVSRQQRAD